MKRVKNILAHKDYRALIENFLSLGALQVVNLLLPLLVLPYMIRVVGFEKYGIIVVASSLVMYFQSLVDYSFIITATRDVAVFRNSKQRLDLIFSRVMTVKVIFLIVSLLTITLIAFLVPKFSEYKTVILFSMLMLIGNVLFPDWYFQGVEKMKYITIINALVKIFFTISIFVFIKKEEDYWAYPLIQSLGYIFAGIMALYVVLVKHKIRFIRLKMKQIKKAIADNFPIFINQFTPVLYNNTSSVLLGLLVSNASAGLFDALRKIVDLGIMLLEVVSRVFFPFLNRRKDFFSKYKTMLLGMVTLMIMIILILSNFIFKFLHITDDNAFNLLLILSLGIVGIGMYNVFATSYLIIYRQDKLVMRNTVYVSLIGFTVSFPLIYYLGILGGVISLSLSRLLLGVGAFYLYNKFRQGKL